MEECALADLLVDQTPAASLPADVAGYSALMHDDERVTRRFGRPARPEQAGCPALGAAAVILLVVGIGSWQACPAGSGGLMSIVGAAQFRVTLPDGPSIAV